MTSDMAIFASGSGSNFAAIADAWPQRVGLLLCNEARAPVIERARERNITVATVPHANHSSRQEHEHAVLRTLREHFEPGALRLICLAGYMRVLSAQGLQDLNAAFPNLCILNLHPARPQDYRGPRGYDHAVQNRFVHWGLTVHRVTAALDEGPVVASSEHVIYPWEDAAMLHHRLMASEHTLFLEAIRKESP